MIIDTRKYGELQRELDMGEIPLWTGKPDPMREMMTGFVIWIFAVPWTAFAVNGMVNDWKFNRSYGGGISFDWMHILFMVPFVLVGMGMLSSPFIAFFKAKRTIYAITPERVLIVEIGFSRKVATYGVGDLGKIERTERPDRSGDLTFAQKVYTDSEGDKHIEKIKFVGIPEVRAVENLMRETFKRNES